MGAISIAKFVWQNPGNKGKRLKKLLHALEWQAYKRTVREPRTILLANGVRFRAYPDCVTSSALQYADWPEYAELHFCRRNLNREDVVIDVGANVGHFSLLLADIVRPANLICIEPTPISWRRLAENFELNGWPTAGLVQAAVGCSPGVLEFPDSDHPVTTNSVNSAGRAKKRTLVKTVTLDELSRTLEPESVGLVKIDVEGFEAEVFEGAGQFFQRLRPRLVMFESLEKRLNHSLSEKFERWNFRVFQLDRNGNPEQSCLSRQNLFAAPAEVFTRWFPPPE